MQQLQHKLGQRSPDLKSPRTTSTSGRGAQDMYSWEALAQAYGISIGECLSICSLTLVSCISNLHAFHGARLLCVQCTDCICMHISRFGHGTMLLLASIRVPISVQSSTIAVVEGWDCVSQL